MSIHVYFQAVDLDRWQRQVFPYLRGEGEVGELPAEAKRVNEVRDLLYPAYSPALERDRGQADYPDWYDDDLTRLFRPYFVAPREPAEVARVVEAYRKAGPDEAIELLRGQVRLISPAAADAIKKPRRKQGDGADLREGLQELEELHAGFARLRSALTQKKASEIDAGEVLGSTVYDSVLRFNESVEPYWLVNAWFTSSLFSTFRITGVRKLLQPVTVLFKPLVEGMPLKVRKALLASGDETPNCVRAENVAKMRLAVEKAVEKADIDLSSDDYNEQRALLCFLEALTYAEMRGAAFAERIY